MKKRFWILIILAVILLAFIALASWILFPPKFVRLGHCKQDCTMSCVGPDEDCIEYCDCLCNGEGLGTERRNQCSIQVDLPEQNCVAYHYGSCIRNQNQKPEDCEVYSLCICREVLNSVNGTEQVEERHDECVKEAGINIPYSPSWL